MRPSLTQRLLKPFVEMREGEGRMLLLMFAYSFLAMTGYNVIKPADAVAVHQQPRRRQPARTSCSLTGVLIGFVVQGYNQGDEPAAAPVHLPGDAARHGRAAAAVLGAVRTTERRLGGRGVLLLRGAGRQSAHQPVLDAGQRHVRRAAGQAHLRVHRRRREPGRHPRARSSPSCTASARRHQQPAAGRCRRFWRSASSSCSWRDARPEGRGARDPDARPRSSPTKRA